jgi:hypothetical protein
MMRLFEKHKNNLRLADGCIVTDKGVTKASVYAPEVTGKFVFRFLESLDPSRLIWQEQKTDLQPETYRKIGLVCMSLSAMALSAKFGTGMVDYASNTLEVVNNQLIQSMTTFSETK